MKKLTKIDIEKFADEIMDYLEQYDLDDSVCIYYNNKRMRTEHDRRHPENPPKRIIEEDMCPRDYFEYINYNHILSMSFEGPLYDSLNYSGYKEEGLRKIFKKYGTYWECGNSWNLTAYPIDDDMEIEFTPYGRPKKRTDLYRCDRENVPSKILNIMDIWYELSKGVGDVGSCVVGAGFDFTWNDDDYFMLACSPYQGSISWETHQDKIRKLLENIGATDIVYHWGNVD